MNQWLVVISYKPFLPTLCMLLYAPGINEWEKRLPSRISAAPRSAWQPLPLAQLGRAVAMALVAVWHALRDRVSSGALPSGRRPGDVTQKSLGPSSSDLSNEMIQTELLSGQSGPLEASEPDGHIEKVQYIVLHLELTQPRLRKLLIDDFKGR